MQSWFKAQSSRDQIAMVALVIALAVYFLIGVVYQPLVAKQEQLVAANETASEDLRWMLNAAAKVKAAPATTAVKNTGGALSQVIDSSVRRAGLKMKRFQPSGEKQAQIWLENVPYSAAVTWLNELEIERGYQIDSASLSAASQPGLVNLRVRVVDGS